MHPDVRLIAASYLKSLSALPMARAAEPEMGQGRRRRFRALPGGFYALKFPVWFWCAQIARGAAKLSTCTVLFRECALPRKMHPPGNFRTLGLLEETFRTPEARTAGSSIVMAQSTVQSIFLNQLIVRCTVLFEAPSSCERPQASW